MATPDRPIEVPDIHDAVARTARLGVCAFRLTRTFPDVDSLPGPIGRTGPLGWIFKRALSRFAGPFIGEGHIDVANWRHLVDFKGHAESFQQGASHAGPSGEPLPPPWPGDTVTSAPTWHFAILEGLTTVEPSPRSPRVPGARWVRGYCDLRLADSRLPFDLPVPAVDHVARIDSWPVDVMIGPTGICAIETDLEMHTLLVEILGVVPPDVAIDWSRLPRIR